MTVNNLVLTAHQPVYLPWLGLFHKIALADSFVYFDDVQYQKKDWNNRNRIMTNQGPIWLTVPVMSKNHYDQKVKDIPINNQLPWKRKHLKSISMAYRRTRYYSRYIAIFEDVYSRNWEKLSDLNEYLLKFFLEEFRITVPFCRLSDFDIKSTKSDLVLDMCKKMQADIYVFGIQGKDYADVDAFNRANIQVCFQDYRHPVYEQQHGDSFISHLSVIDLLFNHGEDSREIILSGNITKKELAKFFH